MNKLKVYLLHTLSLCASIYFIESSSDNIRVQYFAHIQDKRKNKNLKKKSKRILTRTNFSFELLPNIYLYINPIYLSIYVIWCERNTCKVWSLLCISIYLYVLSSHWDNILFQLPHLSPNMWNQFSFIFS